MDSLTKAVPHFCGQVLIIDNHSDTGQLEILKQYLNSYIFPARLVELEKNYGVGGGRNKSAQLNETDWLIMLDNDMVLIKNPLPALHQAVDYLGAYYVNLPILQSDGIHVFACGGSIYLEPYADSYALGNSSVYPQVSRYEIELQEPFLSTYLFGGASMIHPEQFIKMGMFDEHMLVGFEDIEFSLRLYKEGVKIANAADYCLIHAHDLSTSKEDSTYRTIRFSEKQIKHSAEYIYQKYGLHAWTQWVEKWLNEKNKGTVDRNIELEAEEQPTQLSRYDQYIRLSNSAKPRIALVADARGWVFTNLTAQLERYLGERFIFDVYYYHDFNNPVPLLRQLSTYDLVHFFYRNNLFCLFEPSVYQQFLENQEDYLAFIDNYICKLPLTTSIFDHLFLSKEEIENREAFFQALIIGYSVSSQKLNGIYRAIDCYPDPIMIVDDGVDLDFFKPRNLERLGDTNRPLILGWTGNSRWGMSVDGIDHKGFHSIIKVALEDLQAEGVPVDGYFIDREVNRLPFDKMPDYYNSIDIYLCASDIEGTPNTVLEAMACGVPVISTNVGIVPQAFGPKQSEFIILERSVAAFKQAMQRLVGDPELRLRISTENRERIQEWSWKVKTQNWESFFNNMLERVKSLREDYKVLELRRQLLRNAAQVVIQRYQFLNVRAENERLIREMSVITSAKSYRALVRFRDSRLGRLLIRLMLWWRER
jgi:glycosyltransferase involved in cell wall biosynthesis